MKKYLFILSLLSISVLFSAQTDEKWFGLIELADGFTDEIIINIKENSNSKLVTIDFPLKFISVIFSHEPLFNITSLQNLFGT
jgi:hypothetical protein